MWEGGKRIVEPRVVCNSNLLIVSVKEKLGVSYSKLAKMLGVSKSTLFIIRRVTHCHQAFTSNLRIIFVDPSHMKEFLTPTGVRGKVA